MADLSSTWKRGRFGGGLAAKLVKGGVGGAVVKVGSALLGFGVSIALARTLGADGFGFYTLALALVSVLAIPIQLGLPALIVRETARAFAASNWLLVRGLWRWATVRVVVASIILVVVGQLACQLAGDNLSSEMRWTISIALGAVPFVALGNIRGAALRGMKRVVLGQLPEFVIRPLILVLLVLLVRSVYADGVAPSMAMALFGISAMIAFAIGAVILRRVSPAPLRASRGVSYETRVWIRSVIPLALVSSIQALNGQLDVLVLGAFVEPAEVGIYRVAVQVASVISVPISIINMVVAPFMADLHARGQIEKLEALAVCSSVAALLVAFVIALVLFFAGKMILGGVFGEVFARGYVPMLILCAAHVWISSLGSLVTLASMTRTERHAAASMIVGLLVNVVGCVILIPKIGMVGAAWSSLVSVVIWRVILFRQLRSALGIRLNIFSILGRVWK